MVIMMKGDFIYFLILMVHVKVRLYCSQSFGWVPNRSFFCFFFKTTEFIPCDSVW